MNTIVSLTEAITDLTAARKLLENKEAWARSAYAKNGEGKSVEITDPNACSFCMLGALGRAHGNGKWDYLGYHYLSEIVSDGRGVVGVNDDPNTKHEHVLMAFDFAILAAKDDLKAAKKVVKQ